MTWTVTWTVTWVLVSGVLVMPPFANAPVGGGGVDWTHWGDEKRFIGAKREGLNVDSWGSGHLHKSTSPGGPGPGPWLVTQCPVARERKREREEFIDNQQVTEGQ